MRLTKLIASLGPASRHPKLLQELIYAGMDIARFNFSHADYAKTKEVITILRSLDTPHGPISIMLDTKGPEIRTGDISENIDIEKEEIFFISIDPTLINIHEKVIYCDYPYLIEDLVIGDTIIIDSGNLSVIVQEKQKDRLIVQAKNTASIGSRRHINLPGKKLRLPALIEKDKQDLLRGIEHRIDIIAASFIRTAEHITEIRNFLYEHQGAHIPIIAKIENQEGLENLDAIVQVADGIMIARGDLGVEVAIEELPAYQGYITETCKTYGKPVIYATELLKHMVDHPFPTRAEVSDIYHAVLYGHDALMLSDETAIGKYPLESLTMLHRIAHRAEQDVIRSHTDFISQTDDSYWMDKKYSAKSAHFLVDELDAAGMVVFSTSGYFAKLASAYSPNAPIFAFTPLESTYQQLNILYGVQPFLLTENQSIEENEHTALTILQEQGFVQKNDKIVIAYDGIRDGKKIAQVKVVVL